MVSPPELSVIVPVKDEQDNILPLLHEIQTVSKEWPWIWELVYVDDGSVDATWERIKEARQSETRVRAVLTRLWDLAERGMATNMLSSDRPAAIELAPHTYAYAPDAIEAYARQLTPHVRLVRDYLPHDFTVLLSR